MKIFFLANITRRLRISPQTSAL